MLQGDTRSIQACGRRCEERVWRRRRAIPRTSTPPRQTGREEAAAESSSGVARNAAARPSRRQRYAAARRKVSAKNPARAAKEQRVQSVRSMAAQFTKGMSFLQTKRNIGAGATRCRRASAMRESRSVRIAPASSGARARAPFSYASARCAHSAAGMPAAGRQRAARRPVAALFSASVQAGTDIHQPRQQGGTFVPLQRVFTDSVEEKRGLKNLRAPRPTATAERRIWRQRRRWRRVMVIRRATRNVPREAAAVCAGSVRYMQRQERTTQAGRHCQVYAVAVAPRVAGIAKTTFPGERTANSRKARPRRARRRHTKRNSLRRRDETSSDAEEGRLLCAFSSHM